MLWFLLSQRNQTLLILLFQSIPITNLLILYLDLLQLLMLKQIIDMLYNFPAQVIFGLVMCIKILQYLNRMYGILIARVVR